MALLVKVFVTVINSTNARLDVRQYCLGNVGADAQFRQSRAQRAAQVVINPRAAGRLLNFSVIAASSLRLTLSLTHTGAVPFGD